MQNTPFPGQVSPSPLQLGKAGTEKGGPGDPGVARSQANAWESDHAPWPYCLICRAAEERMNPPPRPRGFGAGTPGFHRGLCRGGGGHYNLKPRRARLELPSKQPIVPSAPSSSPLCSPQRCSPPPPPLRVPKMGSRCHRWSKSDLTWRIQGWQRGRFRSAAGSRAECFINRRPLIKR